MTFKTTIWWDRELERCEEAKSCKDQAEAFERDWLRGMDRSDLAAFYNMEGLERRNGFQIVEIRAVRDKYRLVYVFIPKGAVAYWLSVFRKTGKRNRPEVDTAIKRGKIIYRRFLKQKGSAQ